ALRYPPGRLFPRTRLWALAKDLGAFIPVEPGRPHVDVVSEARLVLPNDFSNVPLLYDMDTTDVQAAQFRGDANDSTDLAVFSFAPAGRLSHAAPRIQVQMINAVFIKDDLFRDVGRVQDTVT